MLRPLPEPSLECMRGEGGDVSFLSDPAQPFERGAGHGGVSDGVDEARNLRSQPGPPRDEAHRVGGAGAQPPLVVVRQELGLVRRHVDAHGAVLLAALARQAEVERLQHLVALPQVDLGAGHHLEQDPRTAASAVLFLARDHEAGAHRSAGHVPALADAHTPNRGVSEPSAVVRIGEVRLHRGRAVVRAEPEVFGDRVRTDHLPRIHLPIGIPDGFELAEGLDDLLPIHLRQELGLGLAVAVLARK